MVPRACSRGEDDVWIEVTPSQRKFNRHSEDHYPAVCDVERLTFEVLEWSKKPETSCINPDFIPILADRGVPRPVLEQQTDAMLANISEALSNSLSSKFTLIKWLDANGNINLCDDTDVQEAPTPASKALVLANVRSGLDTDTD